VLRRETRGRPHFSTPLLLLIEGLCTLCLLAGCATALKRESQCLISLTEDVVQAQEEIQNLETAWRESLVRRDMVFHASSSSPEGKLTVVSGTRSIPEIVGQWMAGAQESAALMEARLAARRSYDQLAAAKIRHHPLLNIFDKVVQRVRTRTEEETILSEVRTIMLAGPASFLFYPLIRWNVRSILWDGNDPDAETDTVTRFCTGRLEPPSPADKLRIPPLPGELPGSTRELPERAHTIPAS